jgi:CopG family transcriptional regulator, nickel-responsive regulator
LERGKQEKVSRISFSLQPKLEEEFDKVSRVMGYNERSKALQLAIRKLIADYALETDPESSVTGGILLLYNHDNRMIDRKITEIGHNHRLVIVSSTHLHLDEERCINITTVHGKYRKVMELERELRRLDGTEQLKSTYFVVRN